VALDRHKAIRQGHNLFLDQPPETLSNIIETLLATEENMWLLQRWRQVCKGWKLHIDSYTGPEGHWQRYLRIELQDLWTPPTKALLKPNNIKASTRSQERSVSAACGPRFIDSMVSF